MRRDVKTTSSIDYKPAMLFDEFVIKIVMVCDSIYDNSAVRDFDGTMSNSANIHDSFTVVCPDDFRYVATVEANIWT